MATDPFSLVVDELWAILEDTAEFCSVVLAGNRAKFDSPDPALQIKEQIGPADRPEVRLVPSAVEPLGCTSSSTKVLFTVNLQIAAGDMRMRKVVFPVLWATIRALSRCRDRLQALEWNGEVGFVKTLKAGSGTFSLSEVDLDRGVAGWLNVLPLTMEMWFATVKV